MSNRTFIVVLTLICAYALLNFFPKSRLAILAATGRTGSCSVSETIGSEDWQRDLTKVRKEMDRGSLIIAQDKALELLQTPAGRWWVNVGDRNFGFVLSEQQHEIYGKGQEGVQPGDVVLDCGANYGAFTRTALKRGAAKVVSIEISPATVECLRRNLTPEIADGRVIIYPKGVWDKPDSLELAVAANSGSSSVVLGREAQDKIRVQVTTIDAIVDELHLTRVDFIKMDIEGAEKQALAGATQTIRRFHPRMALSSEHLPDDYRAIPSAVESICPGYVVKQTDCKDLYFKVRPDVLLFRFVG
jgi:FkbM family methyltransferase